MKSSKYVACSLLLFAMGIMGPSKDATAGSILLINGASGTSESGTTAAITNNFQTQATSLGHTVTVSNGIPGSFVGFDQVWDFRFSNVFALTPAQRAAYIAYLAAGGGMFVMGENSSFTTRNNSVLALITEAGGGTLTFTSVASTQTVRAPFNGPDPITANLLTYAAPGGVNSPGTGSYITDDGAGKGTGIAWGVGDLTNAPAGALTVIFDVNWAQNQFDVPDSTNLLRNVVGFVENEVNPVPEPGTWLLLATGLVGVLGYGWRKRRSA